MRLSNRLRAVVVLLALALSVEPLLAAWTYTQNFDSLSTADLNGQDSWSGDTGFAVQTSVFSQGSKAVAVDILDGRIIDRLVTETGGDAELYFAMRRTGNSGGGNLDFIIRDSGPANRIFIRMGADGNISGYNDGVGYVAASAYSADTWYPINLQFDTTTEQFRFRVCSGGSWGSFTSYLTVNGGSMGNFEGVRLETPDGNSTVTGYYDDITTSDNCTGGGGEPSTVPRLMLLGVG